MNNGKALVAGAAILATGLVGAGGVVYAADGAKFILGAVNSASSTTTLHRTSHGPALTINVGRASAPMVVNSRRRVENFNADLLDGFSAPALQTRTYMFGLPAVSGATDALFSLPDVPKGRYLASFDVVGTMSGAGNTLICHFWDADEEYYGLAYGTSNLNFSTSSGSALLNTKLKPPYRFRCFASTGTFALDGNRHHAIVTLTRVDRLTAKTAHLVARSAAGRPSGGRSPVGR